MAEHKVIEKADSEEEKKKRKLLIIKIIPVAVLAFILIAVSLAWFTIVNFIFLSFRLSGTSPLTIR